MSQTVAIRVILISLLACAFLHYAEAADLCPQTEFNCMNGYCISNSLTCNGDNDCGDNSDELVCERFRCHPSAFQCLNGYCLSRLRFCLYGQDCGDNSDEGFCNKRATEVCPPGWFACPSLGRCIPSQWVCDGITDCNGESEELNCGSHSAKISSNNTEKLPDTTDKNELRSWLWKRKKSGSISDRWGSQVHRIAVALHLTDMSTFESGNRTGEEIRCELTKQLLYRLPKKEMSSQELSLYIHALLVACMDPRDFYGNDLVRDLRNRVEVSSNYTNPFLILVLCNAGDDMTNKDVERVTAAYNSQQRPYWKDYQALSIMALSCIASHSSGLVEKRALKDMLQELKQHQFKSGTNGNIRTIALVTQALLIFKSYGKESDLESILKVLRDGLKRSRSLLNAYYVLPVLQRKSLLNVTSAHCSKQPVEEDEALQKALHVTGDTITVQYSVWMGDEVNVGRTWRLRMLVNTTIYDAIETVEKLDNRQKVEYNFIDDKPYVASVNEKEEDLEIGMFWFIYLKSLNSDEQPKIVKQSPVDIKLTSNQEIILWYKRGIWDSQSLNQEPLTFS